MYGNLSYSLFLRALSMASNLTSIHTIDSKNRITKNIVFLGMIFVTLLILSNLTAFKIAEFKFSHFFLFDKLFGSNEINFPASLIFFPITYLFDNILTEVYGFAVSRLVIWCALICNTIFTLGSLLAVQLHPSSYWPDQSQFALIFNSAPRILFASTIAYLCGEFLNSIVISKVKVMTKGQWLWLRLVISTAIGVFIDSYIFCHIAFLGKIPSHIIWQMIRVQFTFKVAFEILALPFTYGLIGFLKRKDKVDHYDIHTNYNPFVINLDEE